MLVLKRFLPLLLLLVIHHVSAIEVRHTDRDSSQLSSQTSIRLKSRISGSSSVLQPADYEPDEDIFGTHADNTLTPLEGDTNTTTTNTDTNSTANLSAMPAYMTNTTNLSGTTLPLAPPPPPPVLPPVPPTTVTVTKSCDAVGTFQVIFTVAEIPPNGTTYNVYRTTNYWNNRTIVGIANGVETVNINDCLDDIEYFFGVTGVNSLGLESDIFKAMPIKPCLPPPPPEVSCTILDQMTGTMTFAATDQDADQPPIEQFHLLVNNEYQYSVPSTTPPTKVYQFDTLRTGHLNTIGVIAESRAGNSTQGSCAIKPEPNQ